MEKIIWWIFVVMSIQMSCSSPTKNKRQIFREQVLPASGGKIPEDAFRADRLALNRLNKEGIAVPDGVLLEHRHVYNHPHINKVDPEDENFVIRVYQQSEHRYAPVEGRSLHHSPPSIASTYLIRPPISREETNIRTPAQQRPHYQAIFNPGYHIHHAGPHQHTVPSFHRPHNSHHRHPNTFQNHVMKHQTYHSIPVPFILPNKDIQEERAQAQAEAHIKKYDELHYPSGEGISGRIRWLSDNQEPLSTEYENVLPPVSNHYDYSPTLQFYDSSESIYPFEDFPDFLGFRFARKSPEGHLGEATNKKKESKNGQKDESLRLQKRVLTVKCEGDAQC